MQLGRWEELLSDKDDSRVWKAINWKGEFAAERSDGSCLSSDKFRVHFEDILNPDVMNHDIPEVTTEVTIPILDEQISAVEVQKQIKRMDHEKALLIDIAKRKRQKLFVIFIDFSKVCNLMPRDKLFIVLKRLGCGVVMLGVLTAMYRVTQSVVGTALFTTTLVVRQGSPTSCLLFIIYINELVKYY